MKYRKEILKGFKLLDKKKPGWKVDLRKLDMRNPCKCTVGQNFTFFPEGLKFLGVLEKSKQNGFALKATWDYKTFTKEVKILIKEWRKK